MSSGASLHICLIAGESSGDALGAGLMRALKGQAAGQSLTFSGVGGPAMEAEGLHSLFPMTDLSVMGLAEVLPRIPRLLRRIGQTAAHIRKTQPDVVVTIDSPDFSFRVARKVRMEQGGSDIPMIHYVAPTVWAWRPERAAKVASLYDGIICLFPFEPSYFEHEDMKAVFTGHPAAQGGTVPAQIVASFRQEHNIMPGAPTLGLLFGSRMGEINRMGPVLREAAARLAADKPELHLIVPTLPHLKREVRNFMRELTCGFTMTTSPEAKSIAFAAMDAALAVSGTVGLELAMAGVPHAIGYRAHSLTAWIIRRKVKVKYAHLVNILLDRPVVPEFLQEACKPEALYRAATELMDNTKDRERQRNAFAQAQKVLQAGNNEDASARAAAFVLGL